jgi:hypothetical protein
MFLLLFFFLFIKYILCIIFLTTIISYLAVVAATGKTTAEYEIGSAQQSLF